MRVLPLLVSTLALSACASITSLGNTFEGRADYRIIPDRDARYKSGPLLADSVPLNDFSLFQAQPSAASPDNPTFFSKGDFLQINLRTGMIGWFSEGAEQRLVNDLFESPTRGEIAIIANITEGAVAPAGVDTEGNLQGRVVFYSGDIYGEQRLNEFNVPIHGPARYDGGQLTIDIWVLELDRAESEQMGAVLGTLTSLSSQVPSLSIPGLSILNQIGTAFLNSNTDDIIGRFRVTLAQPRVGERVTDPILQVSDVVISRASRTRGDPDMLDSCSYYPRHGLVAQGAPVPPSPNRRLTPCGEQGPNNRNNILVLSIRKVTDGPSIASTVTLAQLNERLSRMQVGTTRAPDMSAAIEQIADVAMSANTYSESVAALERIKAGSSGAPHDLDAEMVLRNIQCALLVERNAGSAIVTEVCGGARAANRQMDREGLARLSGRLTREMCLTDTDLSFAALLGDQPTADNLQQKRAALYAKFTPRSASAAPGTSCQ